jgi:hypothetical protein
MLDIKASQFLALSYNGVTRPPPPYYPRVNYIKSTIYGRMMPSKYSKQTGCVQNIPSTRVSPVGVSISQWGLLVFDLYIHYSGLDITNIQADVVCWQWVRWFRGLTSDFWAENGKRKTTAVARAIEWVAYGFTPAFEL